jgi:hypothetical protein
MLVANNLSSCLSETTADDVPKCLKPSVRHLCNAETFVTPQPHPHHSPFPNSLLPPTLWPGAALC